MQFAKNVFEKVVNEERCILPIIKIVIQNLLLRVCFWGTQHDTGMNSLSLNHILMGMPEFNFNTGYYTDKRA